MKGGDKKKKTLQTLRTHIENIVTEHHVSYEKYGTSLSMEKGVKSKIYNTLIPLYELTSSLQYRDIDNEVLSTLLPRLESVYVKNKCKRADDFVIGRSNKSEAILYIDTNNVVDCGRSEKVAYARVGDYLN